MPLMPGIERALLRRLHVGGAQEPQELAAALGVDHGALVEAIEHLRQAGFGLEETAAGLAWTQDPLDLDADAIAARMEPSQIGCGLSVYRETDSTNNLALSAASRPSAHGTLFFAESQRQGRGRRGRSWHSAPGLGLWFSVALHLPVMPAPGLLSAWPAVALAEAFGPLLGVEVGIKWPNDLVVNDRKLGGILVEQRGPAVAVGVGINLLHAPGDFHPDLAPFATSARQVARGPLPSRQEIASRLITAMDNRFPAVRESPSRLVAAAALRSSLLGRSIWFETGGERRAGLAKAFDSAYGLIVELKGGETLTLYYGEVTCRPVVALF